MSLADRSVSIYLPDESVDRIDEIARGLGVQRATWCRIVILERLRTMEREGVAR